MPLGYFIGEWSKLNLIIILAQFLDNISVSDTVCPYHNVLHDFYTTVLDYHCTLNGKYVQMLNPQPCNSNHGICIIGQFNNS